MARKVDKELAMYRDLMTVPSTFSDGFSLTSLVGAMFIALIMVPGAIYMSLLAGIGIGPAAKWVTVILFIEVARRAHKRLEKPEIFVLFYMAGALVVSPFFGLLWNQFFVTSQAARAAGIAEHLPHWFAPSQPLAEDGTRTFFQLKWLPAIALVIFSSVVGRLDNMVLGYGLFRVASDIEKLPFPMAPIGAQGIMALAEESSEKGEGESSWRWRVFAIGGVLGLAFGAIYTGLPVISGALLNQPIQILPIPFADWTPKTKDILPAVATGLSFNLGQLVIGMVLPFYAMLGSFIAMVIKSVSCVVLYKNGILKTWQPGFTTVDTNFSNYFDFFFSFGIGLMLAIALVGFYTSYRSIRRARKKRLAGEEKFRLRTDEVDPAIRGDIKWWFIIATYLVTTFAYIGLSGLLLKGGYRAHPQVLAIMLFYGFLYTPIISYVTARLEGMAGQVVEIPMVREAMFILSGYRGVDIWFLPVPMHNYGVATVFYRQAELTGTKFWSIWKAQMLLVPTVLLASIFFANFIWSMAPVPSVQYPYADMMWELRAKQSCIIYSSTMGGGYTPFEEALNGWYILIGGVIGLGAFLTMGLFGAPTMMIYGFVRGLNTSMPHVAIPQFIGACISKFHFERKMGLKWRQYVPVMSAGFACGMGLITVFSIGIMFLAKAVFQLPF